MSYTHLSYILTMSLVIMLGFSSCSKSDDDGEGGGSTSAGVLDKDSNKRIKTVGRYAFFYNEKGQIDYITYVNRRYSFSYTPNKIIMTHNGEEEAVYSVTYNSQGYISRMEVQEEFDEGGILEGTGSSTLSYDNSGHLVSVKGSSTQTYKGKTRKGSGTVTLNWKNNRLTSAEWTTTEEDDEYGTRIFTDAYDYNYADNINDFHNIHHQYAPSLSGAYGDDPDEALAFVGLLGRGSLYLPTSCTKTWYETAKTRADDSGSSTERFSYGFNGDGSINYCNVNNTHYNYSYEDHPAGTRSISLNDSDNGHKLFRLFFLHRTH